MRPSRRGSRLAVRKCGGTIAAPRPLPGVPATIILILELVLLTVGIVALIRGEIPLTKAYWVDGWPARSAGAVLLLPLPLALTVGFIVGLLQRTPEGPAQPTDLVLYVDVPQMAVCGFLAMGICLGLGGR